jgi:hypothetical protein
VRVHVPPRQVNLVPPPTFCPSPAAKAGGGRGDPCGAWSRIRKVEGGLVQLRGRQVEAGRGLLGRPEGLYF